MTEHDEDVPAEESEAVDEEEGEEEEELSIAEKVIGVYIAPINTFKYLAQRPDFWTAFIILSLIGIAIGTVMLPRTLPIVQSGTVERMQESFTAQGMSESEQATALSIMVKATRISTYVGAIIGPPIQYAIGWLLLTALVFFIALIQGLDTDFKRLLGVIPWLTFISIGSSISAAIRLMNTELVSMEQMQKLQMEMPLSVGALIPEGVNLPAFIDGILGLIDPFFIWSTVVMVFALQYANRCTRAQAITTTIIATIIILLVIAGMMTLGKMAQSFG
jgi:hypothetical protein